MTIIEGYHVCQNEPFTDISLRVGNAIKTLGSITEFPVNRPRLAALICHMRSRRMSQEEYLIL